MYQIWFVTPSQIFELLHVFKWFISYLFKDFALHSGVETPYSFYILTVFTSRLISLLASVRTSTLFLNGIHVTSKYIYVISIGQKLVCPIWVQFPLTLLELPNGVFWKRWSAIAIKHLLVIHHFEYGRAQANVCIYALYYRLHLMTF
jgi:hypothetical protein